MKSVIIKDKNGKKMIHIKRTKGKGYCDMEILRTLAGQIEIIVIDENNKRIIWSTHK